jgi:hypothetical protein
MLKIKDIKEIRLLEGNMFSSKSFSVKGYVDVDDSEDPCLKDKELVLRRVKGVFNGKVKGKHYQLFEVSLE